MRRALALIALCGLLVSQTGYAQEFSYIGFEQITVAGTAIGFTASKITNVQTATGSANATIAVCTLETANVNYTVNGTTPTSTVGMLWTSSSDKTFYGNALLRAFNAIRTGSSGQLDCTYFGN